MTSLRRAVVALCAVAVIGGVIDGVFAVRTGKVLGGEYAGDNEFGFIAPVFYRSTKQQFCGGTIVGSQHILTSGQCVDRLTAEHLSVGINVHHIDNTTVFFINVQRIVMHPNFKRQFGVASSDLAILVLDRYIPFGGRLTKIQLSDQQPKQPDNENIYVTAGWGSTRDGSLYGIADLKKVNVTLSSPVECWNVVAADGETLCGYSGSGSPCTGDTGGPLIGNGKLVGVVSTNQCAVWKRSIYVNVYHYRDWINQVIG